MGTYTKGLGAWLSFAAPQALNGEAVQLQLVQFRQQILAPIIMISEDPSSRTPTNQTHHLSCGQPIKSYLALKYLSALTKYSRTSSAVCSLSLSHPVCLPSLKIKHSIVEHLALSVALPCPSQIVLLSVLHHWEYLINI